MAGGEILPLRGRRRPARFSMLLSALGGASCPWNAVERMTSVRLASWVCSRWMRADGGIEYKHAVGLRASAWGREVRREALAALSYRQTRC